MCVELITYFRMKNWVYGQNLDNIFTVMDAQLEITVLKEAKQFYFQHIFKYRQSLEKNQHSLKDKNLGYHKFFGLVYKTEQQRMLVEQVHMIDYALEVISQMKQGFSLYDVLAKEKNPEKLTYQIMMEVYFKSIELPLL